MKQIIIALALIGIVGCAQVGDAPEIERRADVIPASSIQAARMGIEDSEPFLYKVTSMTQGENLCMYRLTPQTVLQDDEISLYTRSPKFKVGDVFHLSRQ